MNINIKKKSITSFNYFFPLKKNINSKEGVDIICNSKFPLHVRNFSVDSVITHNKNILSKVEISSIIMKLLEETKNPPEVIELTESTNYVKSGLDIKPESESELNSNYLKAARKVREIYKPLLLEAESNGDVNSLITLRENFEKELENLSNFIVNPGYKNNSFNLATSTDVMRITQQKSIELSSQFAGVLKKLITKKSERKRDDQVAYVITAGFISDISEKQLGVSIITGLNRAFSHGNTEQNGIVMKQLVGDCTESILETAIGIHLADVVRTMYLAMSEKFQTSLKTFNANDNTDWWARKKLSDKRLKGVVSNIDAPGQFNMKAATKSGAKKKGQKYSSSKEVEYNSFSSLLDFVPRELRWSESIVGLKEAYIAECFFCINKYCSWSDISFLLDKIQERHGLILKPDLFDLLLAVCTKIDENTPLADISMRVPLSYINSVGSLLEKHPLSICLGELFANQDLPCNLVTATKSGVDIEGNIEDSSPEGKGITNYKYLPVGKIGPMFFEHCLPMVCPPLDWVKSQETGTILGGYLSENDQAVLSFNAIRSKSAAHLFISPSYELLNILNGVQKVPFKINTWMLSWVNQNKDFLIQQEVLVDPRYALLQKKKVRDFLTKIFGTDLNQISTVMNAVMQKKGQALIQELTLEVADIFSGLTLWFPTFLDFRGRIYRSGYPSIQGDSLSRNLLMWDLTADKVPSVLTESEGIELLKAVGFAVKKHDSLEEAARCGRYHLENQIPVNGEMEDPLLYASIIFAPYPKDKQPLYKDWFSWYHWFIPARKDASASVYQIMSVLANELMLAVYCNIVNRGDVPPIKDLYSVVYTSFIGFMQSEKDTIIQFVKKMARDSKNMSEPLLMETLKEVHTLLKNKEGPITRKLLKSVIMPYCYNKTVYKASFDVSNEFIFQGYFFGKLPVTYLLTKLIYWFIETKYNSIFQYKELLSSIGELAALFGLSLYWNLGSWASVNQQYMVQSTEKVSITAQRKNVKTRTGFNYKKQLFICDVEKARAASSANQIHSIDARIMYILLDRLLKDNYPCASIHDCVVCTWDASIHMPEKYYNALYDIVKDPMRLIDDLIIQTFAILIPSAYLNGGGCDLESFFCFLQTKEGIVFLEKKFLNKHSNKNLQSLLYELSDILREIAHVEKKRANAEIREQLHLSYFLDSLKKREKDIKAEIKRTKESLKKVHECLGQVSKLYSEFNSINVLKANEVLNFMAKCHDKNKTSCMY